MKTLYVLRHGQAAPEHPSGSDHGRELTRRGRNDIERAARHVLERGGRPTLVLASNAVRTRQSAELCLAVWGNGCQLLLLDELYLAGPANYLFALSARGEEHSSVMLVGHNPGLEALVQLVTDRSEHLATAALVEIELSISRWSELERQSVGQGRLLDLFSE